MIIDAHAHAGGEYSTPESLLEMSKKYGIEKILLCTSPKNSLNLKKPPNIPFMNTPNSIFTLNKMLRFSYNSFIKDKGDGNRYVCELRDKLPELVIPFLWVNPLDPKHMENLKENVLNLKPKGIKLHQAWNAFKIDGSEFGRLIETCRPYRLPFFIHLYSKGDARKLSQFASANQDVVFIVAHLLGLDIFKQCRENLANIHFDTSGSDRVRGVDILEAIKLFGFDHVIFGSDTPYASLEDQITKINKLNLSEDVEEHIFRLNIMKILSKT